MPYLEDKVVVLFTYEFVLITEDTIEGAMNFIEIEFDNDLEIAEDVIVGASIHLIV